jgi:hypothetical protein
MKSILVPLVLAMSAVLSACAGTAAAQPPASKPRETTPQAFATQPLTVPKAAPETSPNLVRMDQQGMIVVEVTPLNLKDASDTLDFDIAMNTHSVDLSMNLATLATLTTDMGASVPASSWDAPGGGHHVSGKLTFPAVKDGKSILDGASKLTLTILNVDAPSRTFEWQLP